MARKAPAVAATPDEPPVRTDGPARERIIHEVLQLLAEAVLVNETKGNRRPDGSVSEGNEPYA